MLCARLPPNVIGFRQAAVSPGRLSQHSHNRFGHLCASQWHCSLSYTSFLARVRLARHLGALPATTTKTDTKMAVKGSLFREFVDTQSDDEGLSGVLVTLQTAIRAIAMKVSRAGLDDLFGGIQGSSGSADRDAQKKLDVVANDVLKELLGNNSSVWVMASEEDDEPIRTQHDDGMYAVVFDPLDGSRNIDASIPTGTIFGVYRVATGGEGGDAQSCVLQPGTQLVAAGYSLYSSGTMLVITLGQGTHGFTLDTQQGEFVLTHPNMTIPKRGQIYSVNDARYFDWPEGLRKYIDTIRQGKGQNPKQYSARYICSLVGDLHRTLLYGGVAMNPRSHLRLVYEGNPLAWVTEQAGGKASDGKRRILDIQPHKLHQRLPLFLGSPEDIDELESYGDVQQLNNPGYTV